MKDFAVISFRLERDTFTKLQTLSTIEDRPISRIIRRLAEAYVKEHEPQGEEKGNGTHQGS